MKKNREIRNKPDFKLQSFNETILGLKRIYPEAIDLGGVNYSEFNSSVYLHFAVGYKN